MIDRRYEIGTRLLFNSTVLGWVPVRVVERYEVLSCLDTLMGYRYVVEHEGGGRSNACHDFELKEGEADA